MNSKSFTIGGTVNLSLQLFRVYYTNFHMEYDLRISQMSGLHSHVWSGSPFSRKFFLVYLHKDNNIEFNMFRSCGELCGPNFRRVLECCL